MKINEKTVSCENDILFVLDAVASGEEEFAILAKSPKRFIQTSGNMLEYNSGQKLYSAENISNEDIKAAFLDYYRGNDGYKKFFRKTSAKAEKETFSDIVRETWHDFLDICIFTTLRFSQDRIYCGIALSSWIFYSVFIFAGIFLFAVYPQSHPDTPALWLGGGAFLFLIGFVILLGNLLRKRAKIENGIFYPDSDYAKEPFPVSEIECIWIRKDNMHCQLGVLHRGDFSLLATYPSGQALKHGCKLAESWNKPLKFGDRYRKIAKSQILMTALMLPFLFFFLYGYSNTIPKLQGVAASKNWIKTPATVVKSELQLRDAQSAYSRTPVLPHQRKAVRIEYKMANKKEAYLLCFEYQFHHNDDTVVGNSYSYFTDIPTNNGLKYLQKIVDDNPVGKEIFCYVNPEIRTLNVVTRSVLWVYFMPYLTMLFIGTLFVIAVSKRLYELILGMIYQNADSSATKTKRKSL